jgi:hypothetical protein
MPDSLTEAQNERLLRTLERLEEVATVFERSLGLPPLELPRRAATVLPFGPKTGRTKGGSDA